MLQEALHPCRPCGFFISSVMAETQGAFFCTVTCELHQLSAELMFWLHGFSSEAFICLQCFVATLRELNRIDSLRNSAHREQKAFHIFTVSWMALIG